MRSEWKSKLIQQINYRLLINKSNFIFNFPKKNKFQNFTSLFIPDVSEINFVSKLEIAKQICIGFLII